MRTSLVRSENRNLYFDDDDEEIQNVEYINYVSPEANKKTITKTS